MAAVGRGFNKVSLQSSWRKNTGIMAGLAHPLRVQILPDEAAPPLRLRSGQALRDFRRVGMFIHHIADINKRVPCSRATTSSTTLRFRIPPLHHHKLLSPPSAPKWSSPSRSFSGNLRTSSPQLSFHRCRIRRHARAHPPSHQRARAGRSIYRNASPQTTIRSQALAGRLGVCLTRTRERLATAFLRLCSVESSQTGRKIKLHAPESSEAGLGERTQALGVEQLSSLCLRRGRTGTGERTTACEDDGCEESVVVPTLRKQRRVGQPRA